MVLSFKDKNGNMNAIGVGKLIKEPRYYDGKTKVCNFTCEVESHKTGRKNERGYDEYETTYLNFVAFKKLADYCRNLEKRDTIFFAGKMEVDEYWTERNQSGDTQYRVSLDFCTVQPEAVVADEYSGDNPFTDLDDDELPDFL